MSSNIFDTIDVVALNRRFKMQVHKKSDLFSDIVRERKSYSSFDLVLFDTLLAEGSHFIDIGAHVGWYTLYAAMQVGPSGRGYAFEPSPANHQLLKQNLELNKINHVAIKPLALSNHTGEAELFLSHQNSGDNGLVTEGRIRNRSEDEKTRVPISTLDTEFTAEEFKNVSFIKMDVQGSEPKILAGMENLLQHHQPCILLEYSPTHIYECGSSPFEIFAFIDKNKYMPFQVLDENGADLRQILRPLSIQDLFQITGKLRESDFGIDILLVPPGFNWPQK